MPDITQSSKGGDRSVKSVMAFNIRSNFSTTLESSSSSSRANPNHSPYHAEIRRLLFHALFRVN